MAQKQLDCFQHCTYLTLIDTVLSNKKRAHTDNSESSFITKTHYSSGKFGVTITVGLSAAEVTLHIYLRDGVTCC